MRRAILSRCVILGGAPDLGRIVREVARFGVTECFIEADVHAAAPPRPVRLAPLDDFLAAPIQAPSDGEKILVCDAARFGSPDLGALLADAAADPDTVASRLLCPRGGTRLPGIAVLRRRALTSGGTLAEILARDDFRRTETTVAENIPDAPRPALFLDRDGTINVDHGYVGTRDRFDWIFGAREAIRGATASGWHVFIVTNQSGVARGYFDEQAVRDLHDWLADEVLRAGGTIDDVRYCPFHEQGSVARYRAASDWRKPAPGMILDLMRAWDLAPDSCVLVGDQPSDIEAAAAAGIAGHRFPGGRLDQFIAPLLHARARHADAAAVPD